jgi:hypothetical protein
LFRLGSKGLAKALATPKQKVRRVDDVGLIEAELEALARDLGEGRISRREWLAARGPLEERAGAARAAIGARVPSALSDVAGVPDIEVVWSGVGLDKRRAVLGALIDRIVVGPASKRGRRSFDPDRLDIVWRY